MQPVIHLHINSSYNDKPTHMVQEGLAISPFITRVPFMETSSFISSLDETLATLPLVCLFLPPFPPPSFFSAYMLSVFSFSFFISPQFIFLNT